MCLHASVLPSVLESIFRHWTFLWRQTDSAFLSITAKYTYSRNIGGMQRAQESQQHGPDCWSSVWIEISGAARDQYVKLERKKKKSAKSFSSWHLLPTEVQGLDWAVTSPICHRRSTKTGKAHTDQNIRTRVQFFIQEGNLHPSLLLNQRPTCSCGGSAWIRPCLVL